MKQTKIINLYGAPGAGKSTLAAGLFYDMKSQGISVELVTEYAKDIVWSESTTVLKDQIFVFAQQHHRIHRLQGKVDYVITDSPILLSCVYNNMNSENQKLNELIIDTYKRYDNINFFVQRSKEYVCNGRMQNEVESDAIACKIVDFLIDQLRDEYQVDTQLAKIYSHTLPCAIIEALRES